MRVPRRRAALFSRDEHGRMADKWIWDEILGNDVLVDSQYRHDLRTTRTTTPKRKAKKEQP